MHSANISCYKDWGQITDHRRRRNVCTDFLGKAFVLVFRVLHCLKSMDGRRLGVQGQMQRGPFSAEMGVGRCGNGSWRILERGVRLCRNGKLSPGLQVEVKDYRSPRCSNETTPLTMTTMNHKIIKVLGLEGPRRASSPAQGQTVYFASRDSADMPRFEKKAAPLSFLSLLLG